MVIVASGNDAQYTLEVLMAMVERENQMQRAKRNGTANGNGFARL